MFESFNISISIQMQYNLLRGDRQTAGARQINIPYGIVAGSITNKLVTVAVSEAEEDTFLSSC